jgi:hypothetical protein
MRHRLIVLVTVALLVPASPARSEEASPTTWYGAPMLVVDVAALGVVFGGVAADSEGLTTMGLLAYSFGGPTVHLGHGNLGRSLGSFTLRLGLPIVGAFVGAGLEECEEGEWLCGLAGAGAGILTGMVVAGLVDDILIAREPRAPSPPRARLFVAPILGTERVGLGIVGSF